MVRTDGQIALSLLTWAALAVLMLIVIVGELLLGSAYSGLESVIPAFGAERTPLLELGVAFGISVEVLLAVTGVLVGYVLADRMFHPVALRLVDVLVGTLAVATLLVFGTFFNMPAPVFAGLALAGTVLGVATVLVVLVMRALLRRAASLHAELEEVV